jgi:hypothetical protein
MNNIKVRDLLILFIVVLFFLNFFYYRYFYITNKNKISQISSELLTTNQRLLLEQEKLFNNLKIFDKIAEYQKTISEKEISLWYLEKNIDFNDQISNVIKQLFIDSGIKLSSLSLTDISKEGSKKFYTFNIKFSTNFQNLLYLIDKIEDHKKPMQITQLNITTTDKAINVDMSLKLITMENL